jgi:hypothetical protein
MAQAIVRGPAQVRHSRTPAIQFLLSTHPALTCLPFGADPCGWQSLVAPHALRLAAAWCALCAAIPLSADGS